MLQHLSAALFAELISQYKFNLAAGVLEHDCHVL